MAIEDYHLVPALISASVALIVVVLTHYFSRRGDRIARRQDKLEELFDALQTLEKAMFPRKKERQERASSFPLTDREFVNQLTSEIMDR